MTFAEKNVVAAAFISKRFNKSRNRVPMFRIKICGITDRQQAADASAAGVDAIGLNFYQPSPRSISEEQAQEIVSAIPDGVMKVGLFVNASLEQMTHFAARLELSAIQLHGDEPPEMVSRLKGIPVIRAFRIQQDNVESMFDYLAQCKQRQRMPAAVLVDAWSPDEYGGTGKQLDYDLVLRCKDRLEGIPLILAGGLDAENVAEAVAATQPDGVDAASGVETSPGQKDIAKVEAFVAAAKSAWLF